MISQVQTVFAVVRNTVNAAIIVIGCVAITAGDVYAQRSVTQGLATKVIDNLYQCPVKVANHRISAMGIDHVFDRIRDQLAPRQRV